MSSKEAALVQVHGPEHPRASGKHLIDILKLGVLVADLIVQHLHPKRHSLQTLQETEEFTAQQNRPLLSVKETYFIH